MNATLDDAAPSLEIRSYRFLWLSLSLLVFLLIFFQIPGEAQDWKGYDEFFNLVRIDGLDSLGLSRFEPGFVIASVILSRLFSSNFVLFGVIAASAICLKCRVINQLSPSRMVFLVTVFFYLVRFASLHELTQLRVACSTSFIFLAFVLAWRSNRIGSIIACVAALAFHISAAVIIPLVLLIQLRSRLLKLFSLKIVIAVSVIVFFTTFFLLKLTVNYFQDIFLVVAMYQEAGFGNEVANPLSVALLLDWAMIIVGLLMWGRLSSMMKYVVLLELIGMAIFYASLDFPVIAHRLREFLSIFWVFFVVEGLQQKTLVKVFSILFVISNFVLYSYIFFFSGNFFL